MKIAITSQGKDLDSLVDQRFGRTKYFLTVDVETGEFACHDNTVNLNAAQGAGIQSAKKVADLNVEAVVTGHVGPKAHGVLSSAGIKIYSYSDGSAREAVEQLKSGKLQALNSADVNSHWI